MRSERLSSFDIEVTVANTFSLIGTDARAAAALFLEPGGSYSRSHDPAGHSGDLAAELSWSQQQAVLRSFASAKDRADRALAAERDGEIDQPAERHVVNLAAVQPLQRPQRDPLSSANLPRAARLT